jgi:hypothetical protein
MLTPEAQIALKINKNRYQWIDRSLNKTIEDGCSLLNKVLKLMRPDVQMNVYAELAKSRALHRLITPSTSLSGILQLNPSAFPLRTKFLVSTMNPNISWIISTPLSLLKSRVLKLKSTFFAIDTFVETQTGGMHRVSLAK